MPTMAILKYMFGNNFMSQESDEQIYSATAYKSKPNRREARNIQKVCIKTGLSEEQVVNSKRWRLFLKHRATKNSRKFKI